ncbi:MAG: hypothetical protein F6J90_21805 [Moorea sp. SIOASIH]|nr:hypothetical protein [Moorena sp. SIOASIH]NEO38826.1 hypothetical protein [Moorena sp. SIOASIH]
MIRWVERASWWNGHPGGTGILVERASWWNGHLYQSEMHPFPKNTLLN